jgi:hypothetical protein
MVMYSLSEEAFKPDSSCVEFWVEYAQLIETVDPFSWREWEDIFTSSEQLV